MATIMNKGVRAKLTTPRAAIHSIIAPERKKIRAPHLSQLEAEDFRFRTITLNLFPAVCCSISELQELTNFMLDTFRKIVNSDIRYQQKMDNLPPFLALRDVCVKFSAAAIRKEDLIFGQLIDYKCYPYLRITLDNIDVAVFIVRCWCRRLGMAPHEYQVVKAVGPQGKKRFSGDTFPLDKSNPYMFKYLLRDKSVTAVRFGAAAEMINGPVDRNEDFYAIPGVRVSQKFGTQINVYTERNLSNLRRELQESEFERLRIMRSKTHAKAIARLEYDRARRRTIYAAITDSYYGRKRYVTCRKSHYASEVMHASCFDDVPLHNALERSKALAERLRPELVADVVGAEEILNVLQCLESKTQQAAAAVEAAAAAPPAVEAGAVDYYSFKTDNFKSRAQLMRYVGDEISFLKPDASLDDIRAADYSGVDVAKAFKLIAAVGNVSIDPQTKQITIKL